MLCHRRMESEVRRPFFRRRTDGNVLTSTRISCSVLPVRRQAVTMLMMAFGPSPKMYGSVRRETVIRWRRAVRGRLRLVDGSSQGCGVGSSVTVDTGGVGGLV